MNTEQVSFSLITKEEFYQIRQSLAQDKSVHPFIDFFYPSFFLRGICFENQLVGLFSLTFINDTALSLSIGIKEEYQRRGIGSKIIELFLEKYSEELKDFPYFIASVAIRNSHGLSFFKKINFPIINIPSLKEEEDLFTIFQKENPYYLKRKLGNYDTK